MNAFAQTAQQITENANVTRRDLQEGDEPRSRYNAAYAEHDDLMEQLEQVEEDLEEASESGDIGGLDARDVLREITAAYDALEALETAIDEGYDDADNDVAPVAPQAQVSLPSSGALSEDNVRDLVEAYTERNVSGFQAFRDDVSWAVQVIQDGEPVQFLINEDDARSMNVDAVEDVEFTCWPPTRR